ncbi:glycosyltransferase [Zavarzinia sp. CC-PAN008]|uniref:glycosyltransferase n=1 Tax=Zavarzinia sp. CC-PAN008 TaxID=3243332 RepID=UPI003F747162
MFSAKLAAALAGAGVAVTFTGLADQGGPAAPWGPANLVFHRIKGRHRGTLAAMALSRGPLVAGRFATTAHRQGIAALLAARSWDAVILDEYGMGWARHLIPAGPRRPVVGFIAHDHAVSVTSSMVRNFRGDPARRAALWLNWRRTLRYEKALVRDVDLVIAIQQLDAERFTADGARRTLVTTPGYDGDRIPARTITAQTPRRVLLFGSFHWLAKQMNLRDIAAACAPPFAAAGIDIDVVGGVPDDLVAELGARHPNMHFHGFVEDPGPWFESARLGLIAEPSGGGFKLKTLDYLFRRVPVAAMANSLNGVPEAVRAHVVVAPDLPALAQACIAAIDDLPRLNAMQDAAYVEATAAFDWATRGAAMRQAIERIAAERATR